MLRLIRRLPAWAEFAIVAGIAFGPSLASNVYFVAGALSRSVPLSQFAEHALPSVLDNLVLLCIYEASVVLLLVALLLVRGWTIARLGVVRPRLGDALIGAVLAVASFVFVAMPQVIQLLLLDEGAVAAVAGPPVAFHPLFSTLVLASIVNPVYEEIFYCGYAIGPLSRWTGRWQAVGASAALRALCHLYQGPFGALSVMAIGLLFGGWYVWRGRLWPLVVAHAFLDFVPLAINAYALSG
jgi:membrane protease YdiL (CAAX protease family)